MITKIATVSMLAFFVSVEIMAQENKNVHPVPADVAESFDMLYPNVKEVGWTYSNELFEGRFGQKEKIVSLFFDKNGNLKKVKSEIQESELPIGARDLIAKDYAGWRVEKAVSIDITGTINYEAEIQKDKEEKALVLIFDRYGTLVKMVSE